MWFPFAKPAGSDAFSQTAGRHLTYCLNVHAGENWAEVFEVIRRFPTAVRRRVAPEQSFGLGLRLGQRAAVELLEPRALESFREYLAGHRFYVFTINGFPYGRFHGKAVKENVYRPDWSTPERRDYTLNLARILAGLLPAGIDGSISTVPLSYRGWSRTHAALDRMIRHLAEVALELSAIQDDQGREIHLGLEPEPDCILETTPETIDFFDRRFIPEAVPLIARSKGCSSERAEILLRRHVGVCFDTCHLSLQYETLADSLAALNAAGIRTSKIQISAALKIRPSPGAFVRLRDFVDPVYLHQVKARGIADSAVSSRGDLETALAAAALAGGITDREWRIHCHVPLYFAGDGDLRSTADDLDAAFFETVRRLGVSHIEMETYTFDVLPAGIRPPDVVASLAAEYAWVKEKLL